MEPTDFKIASGIMVYLGMLGLSMMEYSSTRKANSPFLLVKNVLQFAIGIVCYWLLGFGFAFGNTKSEFIGEDLFGSEDWLDDSSTHGFDFNYLVLLGTFIVFIVNGAVAEKTQYNAYVIYTICISLFVWPVVVAWTYGEGWLYEAMPGSMIEKGSAVVYTFAGAFAVAGAVLTGRRNGRFGMLRDRYHLHRYGTYVFGAFLTILGLIGIPYFFGTKSGFMFLANLWICGSVSSIVSLKLLTFMCTDLDRHYIAIYQGFMAGMVFITSSSDFTTSWEAALHGLMSGGVFSLGIYGFNWLCIDDVMYMGPTFLFPGIFGGVLPGFIDHNEGVYWGGWETGQVLGANVTGTVTIFFWAVFWGIAIFGAMKILNILNLAPVLIEKGMKRRTEITQKGYQVKKGLKEKKKKHKKRVDSHEDEHEHHGESNREGHHDRDELAQDQ
ncbi:hypothetical protein SteCoe_3298 [Stentor coeruleus]|uniref:Ammonium transporter AmtB-like domain-containing protein n=1 Tax=Stentor coeruleus TaxID=5963 RepID=A0A1R2CXM6_9CILI|nr:hypothetical protein SteCoe_3298 [Stentor coeruleus]